LVDLPGTRAKPGARNPSDLAPISSASASGDSAADFASFADRSDRNLGKVLAGRYRIDRYISGGGMGSVYLATQLQLDRVVAIKLLAPSLMRQGDPKFLKRFNLEASIAAKLAHPNIVTIHDYGEDDGQLYIAMEYLDGESLAKLVARDGPLDPERALRIALQIASGLRVAHEQGVVHRDLKPENVIALRQRDVDGRDVVKLLDFGVVKIFQKEDGTPLVDAGELTQSGAMVGSPRYMAPEQINNQQVGPWTDLYALGGILHYMVAGRHPFEGATLLQVLQKHVFSPPPVIEDAHESIKELIAGCLEKKPEERFGSIVEMIQKLRAAIKLVTGITVNSAPAISGIVAPQHDDLSSTIAEAPRPRQMSAAAAPLVEPVDLFAQTHPATASTPDLVRARRSKTPIILGGAMALAVLAMGLVIALRPSEAPAPAPARAAKEAPVVIPKITAEPTQVEVIAPVEPVRRIVQEPPPPPKRAPRREAKPAPKPAAEPDIRLER
jgi:eukaryotic-like serine/threonine-protein kinase